jgi:hypothetical protein
MVGERLLHKPSERPQAIKVGGAIDAWANPCGDPTPYAERTQAIQHTEHDADTCDTGGLAQGQGRTGEELQRRDEGDDIHAGIGERQRFRGASGEGNRTIAVTCNREHGWRRINTKHGGTATGKPARELPGTAARLEH